MKEFEIGRQYLMPSGRVATLMGVEKSTGSHNFKYGNGDPVGLTPWNLRYVVEAPGQ